MAVSFKQAAKQAKYALTALLLVVLGLATYVLLLYGIVMALLGLSGGLN